MEAKWHLKFDEMDLVMEGDPLKQTHSLHVQASSFEAPNYRQNNSAGNKLSFKERRIRGCYIRSTARSVHPPSRGCYIRSTARSVHPPSRGISTSLHSHHETVLTGSTPPAFLIVQVRPETRYQVMDSICAQTLPPNPYIPVFSFSSSIFLLASVFPIPSVGTFSPASLAIAAIYPVCFPLAGSSPVVHVSGFCIGFPGTPASWFCVSAFLSSLIFAEASDLFMVEGSTSDVPFCEARVLMKAFLVGRYVLATTLEYV